MLFSRLSHWSPKLWKSTFRIDRIKYYKRPNGVTNHKWCFRVGLLTKTPSDQKSEILLESRKWAFRVRLLSLWKIGNSIAPSSPIGNGVFASLLKKTPSDQTSEILFESRKCAFRVGHLSLWKIEHCRCASESGVSIFLGVARCVLKNRTCHCASESDVSVFLGARSSCRSAK